jgi:hypothetical protein
MLLLSERAYELDTGRIADLAKHKQTLTKASAVAATVETNKRSTTKGTEDAAEHTVTFPVQSEVIHPVNRCRVTSVTNP